MKAELDERKALAREVFASMDGLTPSTLRALALGLSYAREPLRQFATAIDYSPARSRTTRTSLRCGWPSSSWRTTSAWCPATPTLTIDRPARGPAAPAVAGAGGCARASGKGVGNGGDRPTCLTFSPLAASHHRDTSLTNDSSSVRCDVSGTGTSGAREELRWEFFAVSAVR
jgi:hypothetical protein